MSWLLALPSKLYVYAGIVLAFAATVYAVWIKGGQHEKDKQIKRDLEAMTEAQKIEEAVAGNLPEDNRKELNKWSRG